MYSETAVKACIYMYITEVIRLCPHIQCACTHQTFRLQTFLGLLLNGDTLEVIIHPQTFCQLLMGTQ